VSSHLFVDETKHRNHLMVAAVVLPADLQLVRSLVLPGQRRVHMKKESEPRKRLIADTIAGSSVEAVIFDAGNGYGSELDARRACLQAVMTYADDLGATRVVFEQDDSLWRWDTQRLVEITRAVGCRATLQVWAPPRRRRRVTRFARRDRLVGGVSGESNLGERHWLKRCRRVYRIRSFAIDPWQDTRRRAGSSDRSPAVSTVGRSGAPRRCKARNRAVRTTKENGLAR